MQRRVAFRPRPRLPAAQPGGRRGEQRAALRQRQPLDVGPAHLAEERREVARLHPHVSRGESPEMLLGGGRQLPRPRQVQHALPAARLDRLPQHGRLPRPGTAVHQAHRAFVPDELELIRRPGPADEVGVVDLVLRERQVVVEGAGLERPVVVVVADRADQDAAAAGERDAAGGPAPLHRPPQVVLHAAAAAERRAPPAAVRRVTAALHNGRAPVRGQVLQHDAQSLAKLRHPAEAVRNLGVHPQRVRQAAERELAPRAGVALQRRPSRRPRARQRERTRRSRPRVGPPERLRDLPAVVPRQRQRWVSGHHRGQTEHPSRRSGHLALVDVENPRQLLDRLRLCLHSMRSPRRPAMSGHRSANTQRRQTTPLPRGRRFAAVYAVAPRMLTTRSIVCPCRPRMAQGRVRRWRAPTERAGMRRRDKRAAPEESECWQQHPPPTSVGDSHRDDQVGGASRVSSLFGPLVVEHAEGGPPRGSPRAERSGKQSEHRVTSSHGADLAADGPSTRRRRRPQRRPERVAPTA